MNQHERISSFLFFGFLPEFDECEISSVFPEIDSPDLLKDLDLHSKAEDEIVDLGSCALKAAFSDCLDKNPSENYILPLSGGLDSRAVLANLIELGVKEHVTAVTFGVSGSWDFEIARGMARELDFPHECIDLTEIKVSTEKLYQTAKNGGAWTFLLDAFYNSLIPQKFGTDAVYWSGYMGETLGGYAVNPVVVEGFTSWQDAVLRHSKNTNLLLGTMDLYPSAFDPILIFPSNPFLDKEAMDYYDQLCFFNYYKNYLQRVVIPDGYHYVLPFSNLEWVKFILRVPLRLRMNRYIYKKILSRAYPDLFSYPVSENWGGSLNSSLPLLFFRHTLNWIRMRAAPSHVWWDRLGVNRVLQYLDYDDALREREDFRLMVSENINNLNERQIVDWLDLDQLWLDHQTHKRDLGKELLLMTALEISLKVEDEKGELL